MEIWISIDIKKDALQKPSKVLREEVFVKNNENCLNFYVIFDIKYSTVPIYTVMPYNKLYTDIRIYLLPIVPHGGATTLIAKTRSVNGEKFKGSDLYFSGGKRMAVLSVI